MTSSQGNMYREMKAEMTRQKKKKQCDSEGQETFAFILFY